MYRMFLVLVLALLYVRAQAELKPGDAAPDNLGKTRNGQTVSARSLRGKVVVISFWDSWCPYCMKEMPVLANLQALADQRKLPLQVVSIDDQERRTTFIQIARVLQPRYPNLVLAWDSDGKVGKPFGTAQGIPVMVMLHRDGSVAHVHVGHGEEMLDTLVAEINSLISETPTAVPEAVDAPSHN